MHGLPGIPSSRFSITNANGLWEYSPFLCGVGLMEGLELAYLFSMKVWDQMLEPALLAHLHNMLVQKGYLKKPIWLFRVLESAFKSAFFVDGEVPQSNFAPALLALIRKFSSYQPRSQRQAGGPAFESTTIHHIMSPDANRFYKQKSNLILYREANWNVEQIPDANIDFHTMHALFRLGQTKHTVDPATGRKRLEETDLVQRARAAGMTDEMLSFRVLNECLRSISSDPNEANVAILQSMPNNFTVEQFLDGVKDGTTTTPTATQRSSGKGKGKGNRNANDDVDDDNDPVEVSGRNLLGGLIKSDIFGDVCGGTPCPLSSLNYVSITAMCIFLFQQMEEELAKLRNPLYLRVYEMESEWNAYKRASLTLLALSEQDDECLRVMAHRFQFVRRVFKSHTYWDGLKTRAEWEDTGPAEGVDGVDQCVVM
jgi:hypothetical protein